MVNVRKKLQVDLHFSRLLADLFWIPNIQIQCAKKHFFTILKGNLEVCMDSVIFNLDKQNSR